MDGYGVMTAFSFLYTPSCEPRLSSERPHYLDTWAVTAGKGGVGWVHNRAAACVAAGGGIFENRL
jgi:hypothetical protein